jgi:hypothetical protein
MSGITDSAKFNKNSSYYLEIDPPAGGGQIINGNLVVNGNETINGNTNVNGNIINSGSNTVGGTVTILGGAGGTALTVGQNGSPRDMVVTGASNMAQIFGTDINLTGGLLTGSATLPNGSIVGFNGSNAVPPNFPLGLLVAGQALSTGVTSASSAGTNSSWWVRFKAPGASYSFALVGGTGAFSGGTNGGMSIFGIPYISVIAGVGGSVKGENVLVTLDPGGLNPTTGEIKFFSSNTAGVPSGTGVAMYGIALVLCPP